MENCPESWHQVIGGKSTHLNCMCLHQSPAARPALDQKNYGLAEGNADQS